MAAGSDPLTLRVGETLTCRAAIGGKVVSFETRVRHVDALGLYLDRPGGLATQLVAGVEILVRYIRQDAAYQFLSLVREVPGVENPEEDLAVTQTDPSKLILRANPLILGYPKRITRFQRRAHPRAWERGVIQVRRPSGDTRDWRGYIVNLSAGGVRFATKQAGFLEGVTNPLGIRLLVSLIMPKGLDVPSLLAEIKRVTVDSTDDDDYLIVQVSFVDLPAKAQSKIEAWVNKHGGDEIV